MNQTYAVLDLGSNSFHMLVAKVDSDGTIQTIDRLKDKVRLAAGLDANKYLSQSIQDRALQYFSQYSDRLRSIPTENIRIVATDTFRKAKNGASFHHTAELVLGHPIEIISGLEEARLIHTGVSSFFPSAERRLIMDIGGGSTEVILSDNNTPLHLASLKMGCVSWTTQYFKEGSLSTENFQKALAACVQTIAPHVNAYQQLGWSTVFGTSGTIKAIETIAQSMEPIGEGITRSKLEQMLPILQKFESSQAIDFPVISEDRKEVLAGGLCILLALFRTFNLSKMEWLPAALREGAFIEMMGRVTGNDVRDHAVQALGQRLQIDSAQNQRILDELQQCLPTIIGAWKTTAEDHAFLRWAVHLHEVGRGISFSGYHRHSGYIVRNADLAGFSRAEQLQLSMLIRLHRGKIRLYEFPEWAPTKHILRLLAILRIVIRLHRKRESIAFEWTFKLENDLIEIQSATDLATEFPLAATDLAFEQEQLKAIGITLTF